MGAEIQSKPAPSSPSVCAQITTERRPARNYDYDSRDSTLGAPILEAYPRQERNSFVSHRDTPIGSHGADSFSVTHVLSPDPNAPFDGSRRVGHIGLLPSHAGTPHSET